MAVTNGTGVEERSVIRGYLAGGDFGREVICAHSGAEQTRAAGVPRKIK